MNIMYHRIANKPTCCNISLFEKQIRYAKKIGATLTFDDGLKEHYTISLPVLKKYDMKGVYFIITNFEKQVMVPHKIWLLLDKSSELIEKFDISNKRFLPSKWYDYDSIRVANLKYFLNNNQGLLDEIFYSIYNEEQVIEDLYMNWDEIKELHNNNMVIGSHSHTHPFLSELSFKEQDKEINISTNIIKKKTGKPTVFAYPFGSYNNDTIVLLKKHGYRWAVTSEPETMFTLSRVDTNEFN